jgi:hypothetical protein
VTVTPPPVRLALTDPQWQHLFETERRLRPSDRRPFFAAVAAIFAGRAEVSDGELNEAMRKLLESGAYRAKRVRHVPRRLGPYW